MRAIRKLLLTAGLITGIPWSTSTMGAMEAPTPNIIASWPVPTLQVDGDLSDWPGGTQRFPIAQRLWGDTPKGTSDFSAEFQTGYNAALNTLYIAVIIDDDSTELTPQYPKWHLQDSYSLFLNEQHDRKGSGVAHFMFAPNFWDMGPLEGHWDPEIANYQNKDMVAHAVSRSGTRTIIEVALKLTMPIEVGRTIGLGHWYHDKDPDGTSCLGWVGKGGKPDDGRPDRIGTLVFAGEGLSMADIQGMVKWKDTGISMVPEGVFLVSTTDDRKWFHLPLDATGQYRATVPVGQYWILPGKYAFFNGDQYVKVDRATQATCTVEGKTVNQAPTLFLQRSAQPPCEDKGHQLVDWTDQSKKAIDAFIETYREYYQIEGVSFAALKKGKVIYAQNYGTSNAYTGKAVDNRTLFEVASMTKPVFAYAVMRLVEKGRLDLDRPLADYLVFDAIKDHPFAKALTARHILSHQSGLPNWAENGRLEFLFEPGARFGYSGEAYEYLKRVVETITGKDIEQILEEEVMGPLGLQHFYFSKNPYAYAHKSSGHYNGYPGKRDLPEHPWVAGGLVTTATDYLSFAKAILDREGLSPETYVLMLGEQVKVPETFREGNWGYPEYMGLGWFVEETPYGRVFRHSGNNGDFDCMFRIYEDLDIAYVIATNGNSGFYLTNAIERILIDPSKWDTKTQNDR